MSVNWQDVITSVGTVVGGSAAFLGAAVWLAKTVITDRVTREAESFKRRLETEATTAIERLRYSLQMEALEHQVRFSKLHEKRAEVIAEMYNLLVEFHLFGEHFAVDDAFGDEKQFTEAYKRVQDLGRHLLLFVQRNRLYLPEELCSSVETLARTITQSVETVQIMARTLSSNLDPLREHREFRTKRFREAWETFDKDVPAMRKLLEKEFRELLGGAKATKTAAADG